MKNTTTLLVLTLSLIALPFTGAKTFATSEPVQTFLDPSLPPEQILIKKGVGLVLVGSQEEVLDHKQLEDIKGFQAIGLRIPGGAHGLQEKLAPLYLDQQIDVATVEKIQNTIIAYFRENHHPFMVVGLPEQDVTAGVLQLIVYESTLNDFIVRGHEWSSPDKLEGYFGLETGRTINQQGLLETLHFINRNPFRSATLVYAPGIEPGTTDILLRVEDRKPWRVYAGAENTGTPSTDRQRWFAGFNHGNVFGLHHIIGYQYTASYDVDKFQAHTVQYIAPLPNQHILNVYGGVSFVHPKLRNPVSRNEGFSGRGSLRYTIPFLTGNYLHQELIFGGDYRRTNNTIEYSDIFPRFGNTVTLTQLAFEYGAIYQREDYTVDFLAQLFWSPGAWLSDQSDEDFSSLRPGAGNYWVYGTATLVYIQKLPQDFSIYLEAQGQLSAQDLLFSQQFDVGGYSTVRGYEAYQLTGENGALGRFEIRSPVFQLFTMCANKPKNPDALQFLVFFDAGYTRFKTRLLGAPKDDYLIGTGPGLRYAWNPYLTARLDWGIKLHRSSRFSGGDSMVHFAVTGSY